MNLNKISDATKILIIAGTIIIVCVIVALGFKMINEGRASAGSGINQFNSMTSEYSDVSLTNYDGANVLGSEVISLIKKAKEREYIFTINVKTKLGTKIEYHGTAPSPLSTSPTSNDYINPNAQFLGVVTKNDNGIIIDISFTQEN